MKKATTFWGVVFLETLAVWLFFYEYPGIPPLNIQETVVVAAAAALLTLGIRKVLKQLKSGRDYDQDE